MKIKIGDKIFDSAKEPIMIVFEGYEKESIKNMSDSDMHFCCFPQSYNDVTKIVKFMEEI